MFYCWRVVLVVGVAFWLLTDLVEVARRAKNYCDADPLSLIKMDAGAAGHGENLPQVEN